MVRFNDAEVLGPAQSYSHHIDRVTVDFCNNSPILTLKVVSQYQEWENPYLIH